MITRFTDGLLLAVLSIGAGLLIVGCGGGGGAGGVTLANVSSAGLVSKTIGLEFAAVEAVSVGGQTITSLPASGDVRTIILKVFAGPSDESEVTTEVRISLPPFIGEVIVRDIEPGMKLLTVDALDATDIPIFEGSLIVDFQAGTPSFVNFRANPVVTLSASTFTGGLIPAGTNAFLSSAESPYTVTQPIDIDEGALLIIQEGVEIRFATPTEATSAPADLRVLGRLTANGTQGQPIRMVRASSQNRSPRPRITVAMQQNTGLQSFIQNCIIQGASIGVVVQNAVATVANNQITSVTNGVVCTSAAISAVNRNTISSDRDGIVVINSPSVSVTNNVVTAGTSASGAISVFSSDIRVETNQTVGGNNGILLSRSAANLSGNRATRPRLAGISVQQSLASIQKSVITSCGVGIDILGSAGSSGNRVTVKSNRIHSCTQAIAAIGSDPVIEGNIISGNEVGIAINAVPVQPLSNPLIIGNNIIDNQAVAVGANLNTQVPSPGGGVLGNADGTGGNFISGNNQQEGADLAPQDGGTVDGVFDISTPQVTSVDAYRSSTDAALDLSEVPNL